QYFHTWAQMERALHSTIGFALSIDATKVQILAANINFRNKLSILSTLVDASSAFNTDEKKEHLKTIETFPQNANRNMIAHTAFEPYQNGVRFEKVKAKKKLEAITEEWDVQDFEGEATKVDEFRTFIEELGARFPKANTVRRSYQKGRTT